MPFFNLNHFEDEGVLHEHSKYMNDAGNNLKIELPLTNLHMFIKRSLIYDNEQEGNFQLFISQDAVLNNNILEEEAYPSLDSSEAFRLRRVASHRVEDVHQHKEQGHQQRHSTWN